jgi:phosphate transport system substrate-binding protein
MRLHGAYSFSFFGAVLLTAVTAWAQTPVDPALSAFQPGEGLSGKITLTGSDTMAQIAATWGDSFRKYHPDVEFDIQVKGSRDAIVAVQDGQATFGLLSRQVTQEEVQEFHDKYGYLPTVLTPALEPLAVMVHKDNPIESLTLAQLDAAFSQSLKRGAAKTATTWGDLGLTGKWANVPVVCQVRGSDTGSQLFFQAVILGGGEFRNDVIAHKSNLELERAIAQDPRSIGFAGSSYLAPEVKAVPLAWKAGEEPINIHASGYPLIRPLQLVVNNPPEGKGQISNLEREFIKFVFSRNGQQDVVIGGFLPIPARAAQMALDATGTAHQL